MCSGAVYGWFSCPRQSFRTLRRCPQHVVHTTSQLAQYTQSNSWEVFHHTAQYCGWGRSSLPSTPSPHPTSEMTRWVSWWCNVRLWLDRLGRSQTCYQKLEPWWDPVVRTEHRSWSGVANWRHPSAHTLVPRNRNVSLWNYIRRVEEGGLQYTAAISSSCGRAGCSAANFVAAVQRLQRFHCTTILGF